jgi:DNA-binding response OmpR family regulator
MNEKVLIFDDDADILEVCTIVLETNGFTVSTQKDCEEILSTIDRYTPDVLLMDNKIPRLAAEAGADHFIEKPFDLDALVSTLRKAIASRKAAR